MLDHNASLAERAITATALLRTDVTSGDGLAFAPQSGGLDVRDDAIEVAKAIAPYEPFSTLASLGDATTLYGVEDELASFISGLGDDRPFDQLDERHDDASRLRALIDDAARNLPERYRAPFVDRVRLLCEELDEEEPGRVPSVESLQYLLAFLRANATFRHPVLALTPNGFFRAEWHEASDRHLAITFLPDGDVRYVVFASRSRVRTLAKVERHTGVTSVDRLMKVLRPHRVHRWTRA